MQVAKLEGADSAGDHFGESVAVHGNKIIIGSFYDNAKANDSGSAYVYDKNENSVWVKVARLNASDGAAGDHFSFGHMGVSVSGNVIVIGAYNDDDLGSNSGSAYVFEKNTSTNAWAQVAKLKADNFGEYRSYGNKDDYFGQAVAVSGNVIAIGAPVLL